jgi:lysophospholipase L1-like esterase
MRCGDRKRALKTTTRWSWLAASLVAVSVGCNSGSGGPASPQTGGTGVSASGGKGSGGSNGSGGTTGGQGSGGSAGAGSGGSGSGGTGGTSATGRGGTTSTGGSGAGGITGTGGGTSVVASTGGAAGAGGGAAGGAPATGGQGSGGKNTGGSTGAGGAATGGTTSGTGGQGGRATGGTSGLGGGATGGASGLGGGAAGGASGAGGESSGYHPCPTDGTACKIMPFGDSITDGYNSDTPGGYRVELFRRAHSAGKNITFVGSGWNGPDTVDGAPFPHNHEGHSGWTIDPEGGRSGISTLLQNNGSNQSVMLKYSPHIVLLMIGTNDAIDNYDMANAPTRLGKLIDTIYAQLPDALIVVAQPIPSRGDGSKGDDTTLSNRIKTYDDAIPAVVKAKADAGKHIFVVDMFTPFNPNKVSLLEDQWHPNLQGYVLLGTQWYQVLQSLL